MAGVSGAATTLHRWPGAVPVNSGDAFTVEVYQDGGAVLDLLVGDATWLAVKQVE